MTTGRTWRRRAVFALVAYGVVWAGFTALRDDPEPVRLALVVGLLAGVGWLMVDCAGVAAAVWPIHPLPTTGLGRTDPRTAAYLRMLEGHLTAGEPDAALRHRLRTLTDQVLRLRCDLELDDPRADDVLGPELVAVLKGPPQRLRTTDIDRYLRRIEEL